MSLSDSQFPDDGSEQADGSGLPEGSEEDRGAIGIFPSWGWVYASVIVYTVLAITLLHIFTVTLDYGLQ